MNLIERVKKIMMSPKEEWLVIEQENTPVAQILTTYLVPLALIPAIATFIGFGVVGYSVPFVGHIAGSHLFWTDSGYYGIYISFFGSVNFRIYYKLISTYL